MKLPVFHALVVMVTTEVLPEFQPEKLKDECPSFGEMFHGLDGRSPRTTTSEPSS